eukprot:3128083-Prymnesium_polylepis.1
MAMKVEGFRPFAQFPPGGPLAPGRRFPVGPAGQKGSKRREFISTSTCKPASPVHVVASVRALCPTRLLPPCHVRMLNEPFMQGYKNIHDRTKRLAIGTCIAIGACCTRRGHTCGHRPCD